jgi:hypothetical protein
LDDPPHKTLVRGEIAVTESKESATCAIDIGRARACIEDLRRSNKKHEMRAASPQVTGMALALALGLLPVVLDELEIVRGRGQERVGTAS